MSCHVCAFSLLFSQRIVELKALRRRLVGWCMDVCVCDDDDKKWKNVLFL